MSPPHFTLFLSRKCTHRHTTSHSDRVNSFHSKSKNAFFDFFPHQTKPASAHERRTLIPTSGWLWVVCKNSTSERCASRKTLPERRQHSSSNFHWYIFIDFFLSHSRECSRKPASHIYTFVVRVHQHEGRSEAIKFEFFSLFQFTFRVEFKYASLLHSSTSFSQLPVSLFLLPSIIFLIW